jgi:hypothetical protein
LVKKCRNCRKIAVSTPEEEQKELDEMLSKYKGDTNGR